MRAQRRAPGLPAQTSDGTIEARYVVAATGPFQQPSIPPIVPDDAPVPQLHSSAYSNPEQLPDGAVLVVGAGSSGVQIADELLRAGRRVFLSVGPHERPPRSYRGRDFCWWLGVLDQWDMETPAAGAEHVTIAVSGARGGHTVDFRDLAARGMDLVGFMTVLRRRRDRLRRPTSPRTSPTATPATCRCSTRPTPTSRASALDLPEEPEARALGPLPARGDRPAARARPRRGRRQRRSSGPPASRATGRWLQVDAFDAPAARATAAASRPSRASTSSACRGSRGAARRSSGACGTTPSTSPTTSTTQRDYLMLRHTPRTRRRRRSTVSA